MSILNESVYQIRKHAIWAAGRGSTMLLGGLLGIGMAVMGPLAVVGIAIGSMLTRYLDNMEFKREQERLGEFYFKEIAAKMNKAESAVKVKDLERLADGNETLSQAVEKNKLVKNMSTAVWVASALATLALVSLTLPVLFPATLAAGGVLAGTLKFAAIFTAFQMFERVFEPMAKRVVKQTRPTQHELIKSLVHSKSKHGEVSQEQVFSVYLDANPKLAQAIEAQYKKPFDQLEAKDKYAVLVKTAANYGIAEVTELINEGRMRPQELAFIVHGDASGVPLRETHASLARARALAGEMVDKARDKANGVAQSLHQRFHRGEKEEPAEAVAIPEDGHVARELKKREAAAVENNPAVPTP